MNSKVVPRLSAALICILCASPAFAELTIIEPIAVGQQNGRDGLSVIEKTPPQSYSVSEVEQLQLENAILRNELTRLQQLQAARYRIEETPSAQPAVSRGSTFPARGSTVVISNSRLNQLVQRARSANQINISGFTDSTGSRRVNQRIAKQRAESLKRRLVQRGIPASKIHTQGILGAYVATNSTASGRAKNRRVVITFH